MNFKLHSNFVKTLIGFKNLIICFLAAAGLCAWVINIIKFYEVYCDVEPKRRALEAANQELANAQEKLTVITQKVVSLEEQLARLTADFEQATADKLKCQQV